MIIKVLIVIIVFKSNGESRTLWKKTERNVKPIH